MNDQSLPAALPTTEQRDRTTAVLCEHFAAGHIDLDALEKRLALVDDAANVAALQNLLSDLPALPAVVEPVEAAVAEPVAARGWALALLGGSSRKGRWTPPRRLNAVALMGGVVLDFRGARLAPGETHVTAVAVMGGIEVIVPPDLPVMVRGLGLLGAVDQVEQAAGEVSPMTPHLKVTALACMGGVEVKTRAREHAERSISKRDE